jgi:dihydrofolate reductase
MRKIVVSEFVSLDGVMEDPGGSGGSEFGGWTVPYWGDDLAAFKAEELFASDALLLGRVTYQDFAAAWPGESDEQGFADRMNSIRKYVVSSTLTTAGWNNTTIVTGDLAAEITKIKDEPGQDILVGGSATLVRALLARHLVDELRLAVYPIVVGAGKPLFDRTGSQAKLKLAHQQSTHTGVLLLTYQHAA